MVGLLFIGNLYLVPGTYYPVPGTGATTGYWYEGLQVGPTNTEIRYYYRYPGMIGLNLLDLGPYTICTIGITGTGAGSQVLSGLHVGPRSFYRGAYRT